MQMAASVSEPNGTALSESSTRQEPHEQTPLLESNRDSNTTSTSAEHLTSQPTLASEEITSVSVPVHGREDEKLSTDIVGVISVLLLGIRPTPMFSPVILHRMDERTHFKTTDSGIGAFIANADGSILLATYSTISSELGSMENASWLVVTYSLATCAIQPTVCCMNGKSNSTLKADANIGSMVN